MSRSISSLVRKCYSSSKIVFQSVKSFSTSPTSCSAAISTNTPLPQLVDSLTDQLSAANIPEPQLSASYLLSKCLSSGDVHVPVYARDWERHDTCLTELQCVKLETLVQCRMSHMPLQYLVGNWDFRDITLLCRPPVFIPRPETEKIVDIIKENLPGAGCNLLEIGPGTGAVSLSLLHECHDIASVTCVDRSKAAVELTLANAELLGLSHKIKVESGRVGTDIEINLDERYDMIYSNPPYILRKDLPTLAPHITLYEDLRALDGGAEGLDVILPILELSGLKLESGGLVILEVDPCHPYILPDKLDKLNHRFTVVDVVKDFTDRDRFMVLKKL